MKWSHPNALVLPVLSWLVQFSSSRIVDFRLDLTWEDSNVAGISRKAIHTNGQVPAPNIRVNQGDQVRVLVNNSMPFGTTVHWHGKLIAARQSASPKPRPLSCRILTYTN